MADSPPASLSIGSAADEDDLSDIDADVRAFVRDLGLPGRARAAAREQLAAGTTIAAHLEISRVLGRGAAGVVYLARDTRLRRDVAVKLVQVSSAAAAARLEGEAQAMARLAHPNVVTVHEVGDFAGELYIAMEYVQGGTLRRWLAESSRTWIEIVQVFAQAAHGLHAAHVAGVLHRDFKPDNVLIGQGRVRVGDFGLARSRDADPPERTMQAVADGARSETTSTQGVVGTPAYLAPEVVLRREHGPLADQFALGVSLFEALCGQRPYPPPGAWMASAATMRRPDPALPAWLREVLLRAVALQPAARFADVDALARALEDGLQRTGRRRRAIAIGTVAMIAVAGGIGLGTNLPKSACADLEMAVDESWNEVRSAEVAAAFRATGSPLAEPAIAAVTRDLAAWSDGWKNERREACEATRVHGDQSEVRMDLRMDCLDRARVQLDALVSVLGEADREVVARTDALLLALPRPDRCADADTSSSGDVVPADRREAYDDLLASVVAAEQQALAGRPARAREALDELVVAIEAQDVPWLAARARLARGTTLAELGLREAAIEDLSAAQAWALGTQDRGLLGQVLLHLGGALGRTSAGTEEALRLLQAAEAAARHSDFPAVARLRIDTMRVQVLQFGGRFAEAERDARAALERAATRESARSQLLTLLAVSIARQHRLEEALGLHREAVAQSETLYGADHPIVATALGNLADCLDDLQRADESLAALRRALAIREAALGTEAPLVGETHRQIADSLRGHGDVAGAIAEYERALGIHRAVGDGAGMVFALVQLANLRSQFDEPSLGISLLLAALPLAEQHFGRESTAVATIEANLTGELLRAELLPAARIHGERALARAERVVGPHDVLVASVCANLGPVLVALGDTNAGLALLERGERIIAATLPPESLRHAQYRNERADILASAQRWPDALALRQQVLADYERVLTADHPDTVFMRYAYGRDLVLAGQPQDAVAPLEECLAALARVQIDPARSGRIHFMLAQALWPDRRARPRAAALARTALAILAPRQDVRVAELRAWMQERRILP